MASLLHALLSRIVLLLMIHTLLAKPLCHPDESSALMEFKRSFQITTAEFRCIYPKVQSWSPNRHGDCCLWDGVECDKASGHVVGLDLSNGCLFGTITSNTSLFHLLHLESLNLAFNDFNSSSIPYGFGNLSRLQYLNLSGSEFSGKVPLDISRLARLTSLDLSSKWASLEMPNIENFVQNLTMLRELDLSLISMPSPFPHILANFSSLKSLVLSNCGLHGEFPVSIFQLPKLEVLDISYNENLSGFIPEQQRGNPLKSLSLAGTIFSSSLPSSLSNLSQLAYLALQGSKFIGQIPASFANLTQLSYLDLSNNNFTGGISHWHLPKLNYLNLSVNQLSGALPFSFENLTQLAVLDLSLNNWQGEIPNSLWELKNLEYLALQHNSLSGTVDLHKLENLTTLFLDFNNISFISKTKFNATLPKLSTLSLVSCNLHEFPRFLGYLNGLECVDLSNNKIRGSIPTWMWNGSKETLMNMDLSHNFLTDFGNSHINLPLPQLTYMDLSHNLFTSFLNKQINLALPILTYLDISSNLLETALPSPPPLARYYNFSNNLFGDIQSICRARSLFILDLSINSLNGTITSCLGNIVSLTILNLGRNKLEGMIPHAYPKGCALRIIDLTNNRLQGPMPRSLVNCPMLEYLNLGYNQIHDGFPSWLSKLTELRAIILKSNKFYGPIETYQSQFNFSSLHIMDLSNNAFNGDFPSKLLQSFHAMKEIVGQDQLEYMNASQRFGLLLYTYKKVVDYEMKLMNKGTEREYSKVPYALKEIDLSNNKFEGCIPDSVGDLKSLVFLNLSNNILSCFIPPSLANLIVLESLDLSRNKLLGEIPQQLAQLTFLSSFDVSHNQLFGPIPRGSQFNTFGASHLP
ncbi:hypothetical protein BT93_C2447 [Corymbia citriodora subsp. variegata]|nr:hypothetical protein BT93_C2447 [Corymbia citriodora subsp. variegata]